MDDMPFSFSEFIQEQPGVGCCGPYADKFHTAAGKIIVLKVNQHQACVHIASSW
jgi:hypothetical protein